MRGCARRPTATLSSALHTDHVKCDHRILQVSFNQWETGRVIILTFREDNFNPINPQFATIRDTEVTSSGTVVAFELSSVGTERLCHTGHVNEAGEFVRDTNCAHEGGAQQALYFSFQLQCPTCISAPEAPTIICHDAPPPPPAPVQTVSHQPSTTTNTGPVFEPGVTFRRTPPSPLPSLHPPPPPALPRVEATSCSSGGRAEVQRRVRGEGEQETLHIVVRPTQWWPTGYVYEIRVRGAGLHIWGPTDAAMLQHEQRGFDEAAVHHYLFSPKQARPSFAFNLDGVDVILLSLTCRLPDPPPSPPLISPPPPPPPPPDTLPLTMGLRSLSSRIAVGVLALIIVSRLAVSFCRSRRVRALRRHSVISAAEGDFNGGSTMGQPGLSTQDAAAEAEDDGNWSVLLVVSGKDLEIPLPQSIASNVDELKHALAELANESLGPKATPAAWLAGDLRTMRVQYVDSLDQPLTLRSSTSFGELCDSPYLRITELKPQK